MGATAVDGPLATASRLAGYSEAAGAALERPKPAWFIATFDLVAILLAIGAVHAIGTMIFFAPPLSDVSATETGSDRIPVAATTTGTTSAVTSSAVLARLAAEARAVVATPDELILFAEPAVFDERFGGGVNAPAAGSFANAEGGPATIRGGNPQAADEPTDTEPQLLAYLPLPERATEAVADLAPQPPLDRIANVAERATGAPIDLTANLRLGVGVEPTPAPAISAGGSAGVQAGGAGGSLEASAVAAVDTTSSVSSSLGGTVSSAGNTAGAAVSAVTGLLR